MHSFLIKSFTCRPTANFGHYLGHLTDLDWQAFFRMPSVYTSETKLSDLQFRFIHRIKATNKLLHAMGKKGSDSYSFCHTESKSIEHSF